jgi:hypothetical protein
MWDVIKKTSSGIEVIRLDNIYSIRYPNGSIGPRTKKDVNLILPFLFKKGDKAGKTVIFYLIKSKMLKVTAVLKTPYIEKIDIDVKYKVENEVFSQDGLTPIQTETMLYARELQQPFKTQELAEYLNPQFFYRGTVYKAKGKAVWSHNLYDILELAGGDEERVERFDFKRRSILTTSTRLAQLEKMGFLKKKIVSGKTLWFIVA